MTLLTLGLLLFFGIHSLPIVSPSARERLVVRIGRGGWRALHSVLSLAGLVLIIIGYGQARHAPVVLYTPPYWLRHVTFALMLPVFPLILAAYLPGRIRAKLVHPMLVAIKTWAVAHLLSNGNLADVLLFGAFLAWAVADRISLKRRASGIALSGWPGPLNDAIAVVAGLGLYVLMVLWGHRVLIGMPLA